LGYWVALFSLLVFLLMLWLMRRYARRPTILFLIAWVPVAVYAGVAWNFRPNIPNMVVLGWLVLYSVASMLTLWVRTSPLKADYVHRIDLSEAVKVERVKHAVDLWKALGMGIALGYMGSLVAWAFAPWALGVMAEKQPQDFELLTTWHGVWIIVFSLYVLCGLLRECSQKAERAADLLLEITNQPASLAGSQKSTQSGRVS